MNLNEGEIRARVEFKKVLLVRFEPKAIELKIDLSLAKIKNCPKEC